MTAVRRGKRVARGAAALAVAATRRPRVRGALERAAPWMLRHGTRLSGWPAEQPGQVIRSWASRLGSLRLPRSGWIAVTALALAKTPPSAGSDTGAPAGSSG
jgi:hypothetical protein